jgi:hypothetical protein
LVVRYAIELGSRGTWAQKGGTHCCRCIKARSLSQAVGPFGGFAGAVAME